MASCAYEQIKAVNRLPSPTGVALEILRLAGDEDTTAEDVASVIESDPAMAARLLKLVNSPLAGVARTIASVSSAVVLLGMRTVKNLALGFSLVSNSRSGSCKGFDYDRFWPDSLGRAVTARHVTRTLQCFNPDEAFTCGLLSQIGCLALAAAYPEAYAHALSLAGPDHPDALRTVEREMFDIDHNALAAEMMADWHLPEVFCAAVRCQDTWQEGNLEPGSRTERLAQTLHLGGSVSAVLLGSRIHRDSLTVLINEANRLGIKPDAFQHMFESIGNAWREAGAIFSIETRNVPSLAEIYAQASKRRKDLEGKGDQPATTLPAGYR